MDKEKKSKTIDKEYMKKAVKNKLFMEDLKEVAKDFESVDLEGW